MFEPFSGLSVLEKPDERWIGPYLIFVGGRSAERFKLHSASSSAAWEVALLVSL